MKDPKTPLGVALRRARNRLILTQRTVAKRIGVTQPNYARWERGDLVPNVKWHRKIHLVLNIHVSEHPPLREFHLKGKDGNEIESDLAVVVRVLYEHLGEYNITGEDVDFAYGLATRLHLPAWQKIVDILVQRSKKAP